MPPLLSDYARTFKIKHFLEGIPKDARILEVGCGDRWFGNYLQANGWEHYVGLDLVPPADVVGDVRDWQRLGIAANSFDVIFAFEFVEHVDIHCFRDFHDLLKPGGLLMLTSPVPHMDWVMRILEWVGLNQKRTSPHDHLVYFQDIPYFEPVEIRTLGFLSQYGKFTKRESSSEPPVSEPAPECNR